MRIERRLSDLQQPFDVVIIGGGITGVNVARETAGRGLRTLLVDKGDFGEGTSSATSKYIHGGIRYLEQYQFGVVRESLRERRILGLAAPHLVSQTRFVMPAWKWSKPGAGLIGAGVGLYRALGYDANRGAPESLRIPNPRWLSKATVRRDIPWINPHELQGAWAYHDTMNVHPERLLLALLQSAVACGAVAMNHMRADSFITSPAPGDGLRVDGVELVDSLTGLRHCVRARTVVNAGGPWMDLVLGELRPRLGVGVNRSKGVHLLTRPLGGRDAVFARAHSGHHVIVSPWQGYSFIGPTDTPMGDTDPDDLGVDGDDVRLLLDTVNDTIDPASSTPLLTEDDIESVSVGIRPLVMKEGSSTYRASRKAELYDHADRGVVNLWSIGGGKWTTGRAIAEHVAETLLRSPALRDVTPLTFDSRRLAVFGTFAWAQDADQYLLQAARSRQELALTPEVRIHLARLYGTEHERILDLVSAEPALGRRISTRPGRLDIAAQAVFAVTDECARTLGDVVHRRLVLGTLGRSTQTELLDVACLIAALLGWNPEQSSAEVSDELNRQELVGRFAAARWAPRATVSVRDDRS